MADKFSTIQVPMKGYKELVKEIRGAAKEKGFGTLAPYIRTILTELGEKGYFKNTKLGITLIKPKK